MKKQRVLELKEIKMYYAKGVFDQFGLRELSFEDIKDVCMELIYTTYPSQSIIINQSCTNKSLKLLLQGTLLIFKRSTIAQSKKDQILDGLQNVQKNITELENKHGKIIRVVSEKVVFGQISSLTNKRATCTVLCQQQCKVLSFIPKQTIFPQILFKLQQRQRFFAQHFNLTHLTKQQFNYELKQFSLEYLDLGVVIPQESKIWIIKQGIVKVQKRTNKKKVGVATLFKGQIINLNLYYKAPSQYTFVSSAFKTYFYTLPINQIDKLPPMLLQKFGQIYSMIDERNQVRRKNQQKCISTIEQISQRAMQKCSKKVLKKNKSKQIYKQIAQNNKYPKSMFKNFKIKLPISSERKLQKNQQQKPFIQQYYKKVHHSLRKYLQSNQLNNQQHTVQQIWRNNLRSKLDARDHMLSCNKEARVHHRLPKLSSQTYIKSSISHNKLQLISFQNALKHI